MTKSSATLAQSTSQLLAGVEGERIVSLVEASRLAGVSVDALKRRHGDKIVRMSEKKSACGFAMCSASRRRCPPPSSHPTI